MTARAVVGGLGLAALAAAIGLGLMLAGSPAAARATRLDARRVDDLAALARDVDVYWSRRSQLPDSLADLGEEGGLTPPVDPVSATPYGYRRLDETHFELCAWFDTASSADRRIPDRRYWAHDAGRQCFRVEVVEAVERLRRVR